MTSNKPTQRDELSKRLKGLRSTPVDLAAFDATLRGVLPPMPGERAGWARLLQRFLTPVSAVTASILVVCVIAAVLMLLAGQPAVASPQRMAEVFRTALADHGNAMPISTIAEAREALSRKWPDSPQLPDEHSGMTPMSCCVHEVGRRQMACVTFVVDGEPIMLALAPASDVRSPKGTEMTIGGTTYLTGSADGVNMVMNAQGGTWTCLMGKLPYSRLAELSASLRN